jgi:17 kDa outer membrane surface antigen
VSDIAQKTLVSRVIRAPRRLRYKGTRKARLWRLRAKAIALSLALGTATSGCSLSYKLDSFTGKDADPAEQTASIRPVSAPSQPADLDLAYAKAAVAELLSRRDKNGSQPWQNPNTGARGTITAVADAYTSDGFQCRDFLASYIRDGAESWLRGDACRIHQGKWTVRSLRPLKRT